MIVNETVKLKFLAYVLGVKPLFVCLVSKDSRMKRGMRHDSENEAGSVKKS
jgi:hypothetical protein